MAQPVPASKAQLRHPICQRALEPVSRVIAIQAVMRPLTGTARLQLRFELLGRRHGSASYRNVSGGDLGRWISPQNPTLGVRAGDVWIVDKRVVDLRAPAAYRFRVSFRWIDAHHRIIATATKLTPKCSQPELRPDLLVRRVRVAATTLPNPSVYLVTVTNAGATAAGMFTVKFAPGGSAAALSLPIFGLAANTDHVLRFTGPACVSGVSPTVTVDPGQQVEDFNRANNVFAVACPPA